MASAADGKECKKAPLAGEPQTKEQGNKFRIAEKRYRLYKGKDKKRKKTDFSNVIDLTGDYKGERAISIQGSSTSSSSEKIWKIPEVEGLYVITGALSLEEQAYWAMKAVAEFSDCAHTNLTNLHGPQPNHWENAVKNMDVGKDSGFYKVRWASLGYHYDWTARLYHKNAKSDFPKELASLANQFAKKVGLEVKSEAAIVNFYPFDGAMGGHVDDAELALDYPIVSVSLGCTAVFLIGGTTRSLEPTAIFVRSGDAVIMGGHSRLCYHGVPRIIQGSCRGLGSILRHPSRSKEEHLLGKFLEKSRINMNVRQVVDGKNTFESAKKIAYPRGNNDAKRSEQR